MVVIIVTIETYALLIMETKEQFTRKQRKKAR
jgi:hypothetical protein